MTHEPRRRSLLRNDALDDDELEQIRRYQDFRTIDWIQDSILERNRRIRATRLNTRTPHRGPRRQLSVSWLWTQTRRALDAGQSWFVVSLVGVCIGLNAAIISIVTEWLSDIKMGYCHDGWWLNQQFCCWEIEGEDVDGCESWHPWSTVSVARWSIYVLFAAMFSFVAAHLVRSLAKYAAGSGISEIKCILAGFVMQGFLGFMTFFVKSIALPLVIASGLSVGKEGPSVHVACCVGSLVAGMFVKFRQSQGKMREIVTAASAAGVAVAFGSPIGGVLFSIEEMSSTFSIKTMWRSFLCALVATFTLSAMNPFRTGKLVLFQVTYDRDWHFFEIMFFIVLGLFGGLYGAFVVKFNLQVAAFRRNHLANHGVAEAVILATITAMIGYGNQFLRMDMTESMSILFHECTNGGNVNNVCETSTQWRIANSLLLATFIRIALVVISYGCKVPAGIFVPSMAIGATFGRMIGIIVKAMYQAYPTSGIFAVCVPDVPCITPGTYAFLGAAAALRYWRHADNRNGRGHYVRAHRRAYLHPSDHGKSRLLSVGDVDLWRQIVLLVTKAVGDFLGTNGIADEMIRFNGFPFLEKEDHAFNVSVSAVMRKDLYTLNESGMRVKDLEATLSATDFKGFPLISEDGTRMLGGYIGRTELQYVLERSRKTQDITPDTLCSFKPDGPDAGADLEEYDLSGALTVGIEEDFSDAMLENNSAAGQQQIKFWPWVNQTPLTVSPQLPLEIVMQLFKRMGPRVILVEDHGVLAGLVTVKDVLRWIAIEKPEREPSWDERGGLDGMLEEVWAWGSGVLEPIVSWSRKLLRRR
ncbi:Chloride channel protein [Mycena kentingensis (nom. inval.)]|nr:Chloride channel protein [Mycena kentingensis (nom. inval.)]